MDEAEIRRVAAELQLLAEHFAEFRKFSTLATL